MPRISNEEVIQKATVTTEALAEGGKLNAAQSDRFIDYVIDQTVLQGNTRIVRFRNESLEINKIGVGKRVAVPKAEAADPGVRRGIKITKISLAPSEIMVPFEISDNFREVNIEGDAIEDTVIRLMATQFANDLEDLYINGNKLGPVRPQAEFEEDGAPNVYMRDNYLALQDGWSKLSDSGHVVDAAGTNVGLGIFGSAIRALPTKFRRNRGDLRWFMSPDMLQLYYEKLATRPTIMADQIINGQGPNLPGPFGIPIVSVPLWDMAPLRVENIVLSGTTPSGLQSTNVTNVVVSPVQSNQFAVAPFAETADYTVDEEAGTITRNGAGGIPSGSTVKVTYRSSPVMLLTHYQNFIVGIGRDIRIEKDRDIYKTVNQYAITARVAVQFEEVDAIVKIVNMGTGV